LTANSGHRRILHLGLGNFHRAHQAVYTEDACGSGERWEITGVAGRNRGIVEALHRQQMRYSVVTLGPAQTVVRQVGSITDAFVSADEPRRVVDEIADPGIRVVSLTVTEKGYDLDALTRRLDLEAPDIRHDLERGPPRSTIGRLAAGLLRRARSCGAPVTLLSCDNITANGTTLAGLLRDFAAAMPQRDGAELLAFLDGAVTCPDTMVDRIVPATTDAHRRLAAEAGFPDAAPVPAEPFSMWVLRDEFAAERPAWEEAGAILTDRVHDYETVKVRLLNGSHSLLAYLGLLTGRDLIADAAADPGIAQAVARLGDEYVPTLDVPDGFDVAAYRSRLDERFANRRLAHRTAQVAADGSFKLAQRVPDAALWHLRRGRVPLVLALTVAAWLRCAARPEGEPVRTAEVPAPADPHAELLGTLAERAARAGSRTERARHLARACLRDQVLLGQQLAEREEFTDTVASLLALLDEGGVAAALEAAGESAR
jgi:fructuronate reductase